jgi:hypothetical protein
MWNTLFDQDQWICHLGWTRESVVSIWNDNRDMAYRVGWHGRTRSESYIQPQSGYDVLGSPCPQLRLLGFKYDVSFITTGEARPGGGSRA